MSQIQKWGNSLAVRIPKVLALELALRPGADVDIAVQDGAVVIRPRGGRVRRKYDLEEMLSRVTDDNLQPFVDPGPPVGREIVVYDGEEPAP